MRIEMSVCYHGIVKAMMRVSDPEDLAYVRSNFATLESVCAAAGRTIDAARRLIGAQYLPSPSYALEP